MDPLEQFNQYYAQMTNPFGPRAVQAMAPRPANPIQPYQPQEEESILSKLGSTALSGLGYVGGVLDKPGRAVRGLLGMASGMHTPWTEALAGVPFSDTLGITDPSNRVSGEDLLKNWGALQGEGEKGTFEARDLAGPALEMATDPLTYLTLGTGSALTETGEQAAKLGRLAPTMAERIAQGQSGLARIGIPFTHAASSGIPIGTGPMAQKIAGMGDTLLDRLTYSAPGRAMSALFDKGVELGGKPAITEPLQRGARLANELLPEKLAAARTPIGQWGRQLVEAGEDPDVLRQIIEGTASAVPGTTTAQIAPQVSDYLDQMLQKERALGVNTGELPNYFPRQRTPLETDVARGGVSPGNPLEPVAGFMAHRDPTLDLPGGTNAVNDLLSNPAISGPNRTLAGPNLLPEAHYIRNNYFPNWNEQEWLHLTGNPGLDPVRFGELEGIRKQAESLAERAAQMDPVYAAEGRRFFGQNPLSDLLWRGESSARVLSKGEAIHGALASSATDIANAGPGAQRIDQVLANAGLTNVAGAHTTAMQHLGITNPADLLGKYIPADVANDVQRAVQGYSRPEALQPVLNAFDSVTNLTKSAMTTPWPARYIRNTLQDLWMSLVKGHLDPGSTVDAYKAFRAGETIPDAHLIPALAHAGTPEEATKELQNLAFAHNVVGPNKITREADIIGGEHAAQRQLVPPGTPQPTLPEILRSAIPGSRAEANPLNIAGIGGRTQSQFAPVVAGRAVDSLSDDVVRGGTFISLLRKGWDPAAAAAETMKTHYDYSNLSQFEKSVMRRVAPFYNWTRQNLPAQLEELASRPGGLTAQAIRGISDAAQAQGGAWQPSFLRDTEAIPVGKEEDGTQRFLSHLGLPFEDAFSLLQTGKGPTQNIERSLQNLAAEGNPLLKAPAELATGVQFMSGRKLSDLQGPTGNVIMDNLLMNSPASRFLSAERTLTDPRKSLAASALNLASPLRVTDVDMMKQRNIAARDYIAEQLSGNPNIRHFESTYVRPEDIPSLTPEEMQLLRLNKTLESRKPIGIKK
jgi:hypothetical protein